VVLPPSPMSMRYAALRFSSLVGNTARNPVFIAAPRGASTSTARWTPRVDYFTIPAYGGPMSWNEIRRRTVAGEAVGVLGVQPEEAIAADGQIESRYSIGQIPPAESGLAPGFVRLLPQCRADGGLQPPRCVAPFDTLRVDPKAVLVFDSRGASTGSDNTPATEVSAGHWTRATLIAGFASGIVQPVDVLQPFFQPSSLRFLPMDVTSALLSENRTVSGFTGHANQLPLVCGSKTSADSALKETRETARAIAADTGAGYDLATSLARQGIRSSVDDLARQAAATPTSMSRSDVLAMSRFLTPPASASKQDTIHLMAPTQYVGEGSVTMIPVRNPLTADMRVDVSLVGARVAAQALPGRDAQGPKADRLKAGPRRPL